MSQRARQRRRFQQNSESDLEDCEDFHQAKDGDGWVELSSQHVLFGLFQKVDMPLAYVCADSKVYEASQWYIYQGMRYPANTHKPSFHLNTNVTAPKRGISDGQRGNQRMPNENIDETMTNKEFYEWLQNAAQSGMFNNVNEMGPGTSSSSSKKKRKEKKQR